MEILIVAGFLGSGKTTLVLSTIERIVERTDKKVAIIVNDFGTIGIDSKVMEKFGLKVSELDGGCICCSLGTDLLSTIQILEENMNPDIVVIEPTGLADPDAIVHAMKHYPGNTPQRILSFVIIDVVRFPSVFKALSRPLSSQIRTADVILMNKIDAISSEMLASVEADIRSIDDSASIIAVSALNDINIDKVVDRIVNS